jgi:hypothetical protein
MTAVTDYNGHTPAPVNEFMPGMKMPEPRTYRTNADYDALAAEVADKIYKDGLTLREYCAAHKNDWEADNETPWLDADGVVKFPDTHLADCAVDRMCKAQEQRQATVRGLDFKTAEKVSRVALEYATIDPWAILRALCDEDLLHVLREVGLA